MESKSESEKFPTMGLKSLLQNSDLLEILLKPLSKGSDTSESPSSDDLTSTLNELNPDHLNDLTSGIDVSKAKCLFPFENSDDCLQNKVKNGETEASNIYGNAFLGPNLWDKNDLFQGGVKFEHLEIDEFLNENGLNETDVEFLDQIQKIDAVDSNSSKSSSSAVSSSILSSVPNTLTQPAPIVTPQQSQQPAFVETEPKIHSSNSQIIGSKNVQVQQQHISNDIETSAVRRNREDSFDWTVDSNDMSMSSSNELDDFDPKVKKFSEDDLRPQPVLRKSKKQFVPTELKDEKYWMRRTKNNIAAKRSRDARRVKENQIAIRASYLERENDVLRKQLEESRRESRLMKNKLEKYELLYPELKDLGEHN